MISIQITPIAGGSVMATLIAQHGKRNHADGEVYNSKPAAEQACRKKAAIYIKEQLLAYAHQRATAYRLNGRLTDAQRYAVDGLNKLKHLYNPDSILNQVKLQENHIDQLLPFPQSKQAYWRQIIEDIKQYCHAAHNNTHQ